MMVVVKMCLQPKFISKDDATTKVGVDNLVMLVVVVVVVVVMVMVTVMMMVMVVMMYLLPKYICEGASNHKYDKEKEHEHIVPETFSIVLH